MSRVRRPTTPNCAIGLSPKRSESWTDTKTIDLSHYQPDELRPFTFERDFTEMPHGSVLASYNVEGFSYDTMKDLSVETIQSRFDQFSRLTDLATSSTVSLSTAWISSPTRTME